jgi:hypothetical protein
VTSPALKLFRRAAVAVRAASTGGARTRGEGAGDGPTLSTTAGSITGSVRDDTSQDVSAADTRGLQARPMFPSPRPAHRTSAPPPTPAANTSSSGQAWGSKGAASMPTLPSRPAYTPSPSTHSDASARATIRAILSTGGKGHGHGTGGHVDGGTILNESMGRGPATPSSKQYLIEIKGGKAYALVPLGPSHALHMTKPRGQAGGHVRDNGGLRATQQQRTPSAKSAGPTSPFMPPFMGSGGVTASRGPVVTRDTYRPSADVGRRGGGTAPLPIRRPSASSITSASSTPRPSQQRQGSLSPTTRLVRRLLSALAESPGVTPWPAKGRGTGR